MIGCFGEFSLRGGRGAETFRWCGAASEICFTSVRLRRKQKANVLFVSEEPRQAGPSKTSDANSARTEAYCENYVRNIIWTSEGVFF